MRSLALALAITLCDVAPARAELFPGQVMIVANRNSSDSLAVAQHYAERRGIPLRQIAKLDLPSDETMSREDYEGKLVRPLRQALQELNLQGKVRVLVTVYGVPLRVLPPEPGAQEQLLHQDAARRLDAARTRMSEVVEKARDLSGQPSADTTPPGNEGQIVWEFERHLAWLARSDQVIQATVKQAKSLDQATRKQWHDRLVAIVRQYQGAAGVLQLRNQLEDVPRTSDRPGEARLRLQYLNGLQLLLDSQDLPVRHNRESWYRQVEVTYGSYGVFGLAALELARLSTEYADASVDSELSLLWWDRDQYAVGWRLANVWYHGLKKAPRRASKEIPVMMVSRLDAPSVKTALGLVDRAMDAEQQGLTGTIYLDARGLPDKRDTYSRYDQSLRELNAFLTQHSSYPMKLENTEERFHRPGDAPDTALYVGWYRLRHYENAFTFRPGAIGYHMASAEAVSIHTASETGWCKNALDRGITATLGSIGEPYLDAFPEPLEFVALMMTGQYSLVEAYALTSRWNSWRMVLFGDPLYNPWKTKPAVRRSALGMFSLAPVAPSDQNFDDPILARDEFKRRQELTRQKLEEIFREAAANPI